MHRLIMSAPPGSEVDHVNHNTMDNRRINLRVATHKVNMGNGRYALTMWCPYGHLYDYANTFMDNEGKRSCRICRRMRKRERYAKHREAILEQQKPKRAQRWASWYARNREQLLPKKRAYEARRRAEGK